MPNNALFSRLAAVFKFAPATDSLATELRHNLQAAQAKLAQQVIAADISARSFEITDTVFQQSRHLFTRAVDYKNVVFAPAQEMLAARIAFVKAYITQSTALRHSYRKATRLKLEAEALQKTLVTQIKPITNQLKALYGDISAIVTGESEAYREGIRELTLKIRSLYTNPQTSQLTLDFDIIARARELALNQVKETLRKNSQAPSTLIPSSRASHRRNQTFIDCSEIMMATEEGKDTPNATPNTLDRQNLAARVRSNSLLYGVFFDQKANGSSPLPSSTDQASLTL